jgi:hypothetical protein
MVLEHRTKDELEDLVTSLLLVVIVMIMVTFWKGSRGLSADGTYGLRGEKSINSPRNRS